MWNNFSHQLQLKKFRRWIRLSKIGRISTKGNIGEINWMRQKWSQLISDLSWIWKQPCVDFKEVFFNIWSYKGRVLNLYRKGWLMNHRWNNKNRERDQKKARMNLWCDVKALFSGYTWLLNGLTILKTTTMRLCLVLELVRLYGTKIIAFLRMV